MVDIPGVGKEQRDHRVQAPAPWHKMGTVTELATCKWLTVMNDE